MKNFTKSIKNALILCCILTSSSLLAQTTITIDNNPGSTTTYKTIQDAHDNATAGDIIYVQPSGTSYGALTIDQSLTIVGRSHSETGKVSELGSVKIRSSAVTLKGLKISNLNPQSSGALTPPPFVGLNIFECEVNSLQLGAGNSASNIITEDVTIRGCYLTSSNYIYEDTKDVLYSNNIFTTSSISIYNTTSAIIANNIFKFTSALNIYNYNSTGTAILYNNMFISNYSGAAVVNLNYGPFNLSNNLTYNYDTSFSASIAFAEVSGGTLTEGNTLAETDPLFTNVDSSVSSSFAGTSSFKPETRLEDDLTLQATSPALTGGGGGTEMGIYNNGFLYNMLGNPRGIPTLDVVTYDGAVPKNSNINVTITAKAH
ncbi:hypothetical protein [Polaribacter sp.]|uniref:hypothetical protein n=1 Tax=Polaribacter sp. TaxID=1920175 RepID=UPI003EF18A8A